MALTYYPIGEDGKRSRKMEAIPAHAIVKVVEGQDGKALVKTTDGQWVQTNQPFRGVAESL